MAKTGIYDMAQTLDDEDTLPFQSAQEAWFWFVQAYTARHDGARITAGAGIWNRPCEPLDILLILEKLRRNRRLLMDHIRVLKHYGVRQIEPDPYREKEARAATLWDEAMMILEDVFIAKGIVKEPHFFPPPLSHSELCEDSMYADVEDIVRGM